MSDKFRIGCSPFSNRIFAGYVNKNNTWRTGKKDVTEDACNAVAQKLLQTKESMQFNYIDGERYELRVVKISQEE